MNWNKIIYTTTILLAAVFAAVAQEPRKGVVIERFETNLTGDALNVEFDIKASGLEMQCDGQLILEFAVETSERRLVLPVVVYSGGRRYRYERRRALLSDDYTPEPYQVYPKVRKNREYELEYRLSVPYYAWMQHAAVTLREYTHDCRGEQLASHGVLLADLNPVGDSNAPLYTAAHGRSGSMASPAYLVSFLDPKAEDTKVRASMIELNIGFPVNQTDVYPSFGNNQTELGRADSLVHIITNNPLLSVSGVSIRGYASPEGRYGANVRLARGRSEGFKAYLMEKYPDNAYMRSATVTWVPEDWDGLARLVRASNLPNKGEVLSVVLDGSIAPDDKEQLLQQIGQWSSVYKPMLGEMFPKLRRIELWVDYMVQKFDNNKARELIYTHPELLSLAEMYYVVRFYEPGSPKYREVYEIAAGQYRDDVVANNNAAAALLQQGLADEALPYLNRIENDPVSYINFGTYYYLKGEREKAIDCFTKARENGSEQAEQNLELIMNYGL